MELAVWQTLLGLTCSLAVCLNLFLLLLIATRSTADICHYKYFLANLTVADLLAALLFLTLLPYPAISADTYGGAMLGPGRLFANPLAGNWIFVLLVTVFVYGTMALAGTFVYRFVLLSPAGLDRKLLSRKSIAVVVSGMVAFCALMCGTLILATRPVIAAAIKQSYPELAALPEALFFGFDQRNVLLPLNNCLCLACNLAADGTMAVFGFQIKGALARHRPSMCLATYELHRRLLQALVVQAVLPLAIFCVPVLVFVASILFQHTDAVLNFVCVLLMSLHPVCNCLVTLLFVRPYRTAVMRGLGWRGATGVDKVPTTVVMKEAVVVRVHR